MSILFLVLAAAALWLTINAVRPLPRRGTNPLWFPALVVGELAPFHAVAQVAAIAVFVHRGAAGGAAGRTALVLMAASIAGLGVSHARSLRTRRVVEQAAADLVGSGVRLRTFRPGRLVRPLPGVPPGVEVERWSYGPDPAHVLERYRRRDLRPGAPVLVQIHGGGWTGGSRARQARPLKHRMAEEGWVVFDVGYRLSPAATFPDHLEDVKRAIAWIRATAGSHGIDASFVAVTGGSAGGQLAALAGLVDSVDLQPGFEEADTSVQVCVPFYGVHDLLNGDRPLWPYLASHVLKAGPRAEPGLWELASPVRVAGPRRPPFLVLHGALDSLVHPDASRRLVERLRSTSSQPVAHAELPGATHGFDAISSVRSLRTVDAVVVVLDALYERHRVASG